MKIKNENENNDVHNESDIENVNTHKNEVRKVSTAQAGVSNGSNRASEVIRTIVPDTSVLIQGKISQMIKSGKLKSAKIIIPQMVMDELQAQASRSKEIGFEGLEEIKRIKEAGKDNIQIEFVGRRPTLEEIQLAKKGRIDALIRDYAAKHNAVLMTADYVQALVAEVEGVSVDYEPQKLRTDGLILENFFNKDTQSVHLKEGVKPLAKVGKPGNMELVELRKEPIEEKELKSIIDQIILKARSDKDASVEMSDHGSLVIQLGNYRIAIARPPFSDAVEVTAVRPIAKVTLDDYKLHEDLEKKIVDQSVGVLIAGPPGSGKSTFAASLADQLVKNNKIVKTFEQPRDLQVGPEVTQYGPLGGEWEKTAEILLLVRPDYTIFDEVRKTRDFRVFADMRLGGVGMIGVMHATNPINAIQRFIGRIELGMIPHVVDIVIYIKNGKVEKVYEVSMSVKVPHGMTEADLARPVVEVRDFETKKLEYEIYSYGEENVVIPITEESVKSGVRELAKWAIKKEFSKYDPNPDVNVISDNDAVVKVRNESIARIIGKGGQNIDQIEKTLGIHISIEPKEKTLKEPINFLVEEMGSHFYLIVEPDLIGNTVDIYSKDDFLFSPIVGKEGRIKVKKKSDMGRNVMRAIASNRLKIVV